MPPVSDLVSDSKLETKFRGEYTEHVYNVSGATPRQRRIEKVERWERIKLLGTGAFGAVWLQKLATENSEEKYRAVKKIRKDVQGHTPVDYGRELEVIAKFSHQKYEMCFVKSFGWYDTDESVYIAMEYFPLGDLQNYLSSPLPEKDAQQIASQILEGLLFMHDNGFAHRDLKPTNILVKSNGPDWWVKIGDFGISKRAEKGVTALRTIVGTPGFFAPEMLVQLGLLDGDGFNFGDEYTVAVDIWSLGEIVFRALTGERPFPRSLGAYIKRNSPFPVDVLRARGISEEGCNFLKCLMAPMPEDRLTAKDALSHIWIEPQKPSSGKVSAEMQRSPTTEDTIPSQEYPNVEASARWSTATGTILKSNVSANPAFPEQVSTTFQPVQNTEGSLLDGKTLASASADEAVRIWDSTTGAVSRTLKGHSDRVFAVTFSPDGKTLASASEDKTVRLWDSTTGTTRHTLKGHSNGVGVVTFSPDGKTLASASWDKTVRLWDPTTGAARRTLEGHSGPVLAVTFSPDGKTLASASWDKTVRLWDPTTGAAYRTLEGHSGEVWAVTFSPDGKTLASASWDTTVRLWDSTTGAARRTLKGHSGAIWAVIFSPDGKTLVSSSGDKTVRLWDPTTGAAYRTLEGHSGKVLAVTFSPDGKNLASASGDETVRLWDSTTGATRHTLKGHSDGVWAVTFSPDGKTLASASWDKTVRLWDLEVIYSQ